jgi:hypothetical protein
LVEAPGIESPDTSKPIVVDRCENDPDRATETDAKPRDGSALADAPPGRTTTDTDAAIRVAAKVAIEAGELARAHALLDLLAAKPAVAAPVIALAARKPTVQEASSPITARRPPRSPR